jgi:hypothetical protein
MKIISIHCKDGELLADRETIEATIGKTGLDIKIKRIFKPLAMHVRFEGAALSAIDSQRSMGKIAAGAIAGGLLLGPVGLLAGGAFGGGRKHSLVLSSPDARVVFEASTSELQSLAGLGLPSAIENQVIEGTLPTFKASINVAAGCALLAILFLVFGIVAVMNTDKRPVGNFVPAVADSVPIQSTVNEQVSTEEQREHDAITARMPSVDTSAHNGQKHRAQRQKAQP